MRGGASREARAAPEDDERANAGADEGRASAHEQPDHDDFDLDKFERELELELDRIEDGRWSWWLAGEVAREWLTLAPLRSAWHDKSRRLGGVTTLGYAALGVMALGVLLDLLVTGPREWFGNHQFTASVVVEALLLAATIGVLNRALERREAAKWQRAAARPHTQVLRWLASAHVYAGNWRYTSKTANATAAAIAADRARDGDLEHLGEQAAQVARARQEFSRCLDRLERALEAFEPLGLAHSSLIERYSSARAYVLQGRRIDGLDLRERDDELDWDDPEAGERTWDQLEWDEAVAAFGRDLETEAQVYTRQLSSYGALIDWPEADTAM